MGKQVMICGVDCHPCDENCNGYCTGKADCPADAPEALVLIRAAVAANNALNGRPVNVTHVWEEPHECAMCGGLGFHAHAVPWYCGPVLEGESEGGYKIVCEPCHDKWAKWSDSLQYQGA